MFEYQFTLDTNRREMTTYDFEILKLSHGDYIWLQNEGGEGFWGNYLGQFERDKGTFRFRNHSNGQEETIDIKKLQRLQKE